MEKLIKKFEDLILNKLELRDRRIRVSLKSKNSPVKCAEECKKVSIEFARYILKSKIQSTSIKDRDLLGNLVVTEYWPKEFQLILGELTKDKEGISFDKFIGEEYGKEDIS
jgi:hypothetical protein